MHSPWLNALMAGSQTPATLPRGAALRRSLTLPPDGCSACFGRPRLQQSHLIQKHAWALVLHLLNLKLEAPHLSAQELAGMRPGSASAARRTMLLPSKVALKAGFVTMSRHPYGCRVVQRILEHCDIEPYTQALLEEVGAVPTPGPLTPPLASAIRPPPQATLYLFECWGVPLP